MRRFFLLSLFICATIFVENQTVLAQDSDGGYYEKLRKLKKPSPSQVEQLRNSTVDEKRRKRVDAVSERSTRDAALPDRPSTRYSESDKVDDGPEPVLKPTAEQIAELENEVASDGKTAKKGPVQASGSAKPREAEKSATAQSRVRPRADESESGSPTVKVDPGDLEELEFPGEPTPKLPVKKKK